MKMKFLVSIFWFSLGLSLSGMELTKQEPENCAICLEPLKEAWPKKINTCHFAEGTHSFHSECISKYLSMEKDPRCCSCRRPFLLGEQIRIDFSNFLNKNTECTISKDGSTLTVNRKKLSIILLGFQDCLNEVEQNFKTSRNRLVFEYEKLALEKNQVVTNYQKLQSDLSSLIRSIKSHKKNCSYDFCDINDQDNEAEFMYTNLKEQYDALEAKKKKQIAKLEDELSIANSQLDLCKIGALAAAGIYVGYHYFWQSR